MLIQHRRSLIGIVKHFFYITSLFVVSLKFFENENKFCSIKIILLKLLEGFIRTNEKAQELIFAVGKHR